MQQRVSPVMIAIAVVLVVGVAFAAYRMSFAPRANSVTPDNRPAYTKGSGSTYGQNPSANGYPTRPGGQ